MQIERIEIPNHKTQITNESLGKKDFLMRIRISRKEAKESANWLRLINETNKLKNADDAPSLMQEANELK